MPRSHILAALASWTLGPTIVPAEDHWAFTPPGDPVVPAACETASAENPIDHFITDTRQPADGRTLIRRATFDLTGLPPSWADVATFLDDRSPDAYPKVLDRLLASPAYGERWGRHWLDVARYADSNGLDENIAHGNAWRYRDYVVEAFNADVPFDRFVTEQLAGDLLPADGTPQRHRQLIATGFLSLGPKVLAEVDERKMEMDIVDEQIDTVGRAFLGLTLGCARCHDHKFDPVSQADYYALAGVFKSTRTMEHFTKIARWHENPIPTDAELARKAEHDRKVAELKAEIKKAAGDAERLKSLQADLTKLEEAAPTLSTAMGVTEGTVTDVPVHLRGDHLTPGEIVGRRVPTVLTGANPPRFDADTSGRLELARWLTRPDHPLTARVMVNRIWRWHFGEGLVLTPDNFGELGKPPTNPELLDWLTCRFVENQWSVKEMHRLVLLSATYRRRSEPRRLEAEAIRDAILAVSGGLDRSMGGSMLHVANREFLFDHTSRDATTYDSPRRSLYLPVIRNHLYDVFELFDCTDGAVLNGDRATTTVAPQALFLLNGELVLDASERFARDLLSGPERDDADRVRELYRRALGRNPTDAEITASVRLVEHVERAIRGDRRPRAWASLCQVVFAANEFVFLK